VIAPVDLVQAAGDRAVPAIVAPVVVDRLPIGKAVDHLQVDRVSVVLAGLPATRKVEGPAVVRANEAQAVPVVRRAGRVIAPVVPAAAVVSAPRLNRARSCHPCSRIG